MVLNNIVQLLNATVICGDQGLGHEIKRAFAADLMSDVLRLNTEEMLLITGLANLQVIRTAEMSDINFILFVRDKKVSPDMLELAQENNITLLQCTQSMFKVCGELYRAGVEPVY